MSVTLFTDGACKGNPGPGGYAAIIQDGREEKVVSGGERHTTNNRMELMAVIAGLEALDGRQRVKVVTDSRYVVSILRDGRARANLDLVGRVRQSAGRHNVTVEHVPGHSGPASAGSAQAMNERCDRLAGVEAERYAQSEKCTCQVANFKDYGSIQALDQAFGDRWVYIGRKNCHAGLPQSPLANPYKRQDFGGQRGATLPHYRRWLWQQIQAGNEAVLKALRAIDNQTVLVCWCHPHPCHVQVVRAAAAWLRSQPDRDSEPVAFVSGHRDLTAAEFDQHYRPRLEKAIAAGHHFVVGDAPGADAMAQTWLAGQVSPGRVTVYHAGRRPRHHSAGFAVCGDYASQSAKDAAMTAASNYDIAWVRPGKETSGTARNLARR